jgi:hypothetical protein
MPNLDVQEAIKKARSYVTDLFNGEPITDIGLEEVEHESDTWKITIGFNRLWKTPTNTVFAMMTQPPGQRFFKVVTISDADAALVSIKNREL